MTQGPPQGLCGGSEKVGIAAGQVTALGHWLHGCREEDAFVPPGAGMKPSPWAGRQEGLQTAPCRGLGLTCPGSPRNELLKGDRPRNKPEG